MWLLAVVLLGLITAFVVQLGEFRTPYDAPPPEVPVRDPKVSTAQTAQFTGFDKDNQPFSVTATTASQDKANPARVILNDVTLQLKMKNSGDTLFVTAKEGVFDNKAKTLDLKGDVHIVNSANYTANMSTARVLLGEKRLISEDPVEVKFPSGDITAGGMEMRDDGQQVYFTNRTRTVFSERSQREDAQKKLKQKN
ncbi:LPS export ABC transporter protein LptC [Rhodoligotrophos appendicifer]|uniref:LPS export ABC transporter periplasmic protein LptC n=1 Tax=Rhodoligotrophos appendicifer TaxID=987056 RepID=UPI001479096B|nr:LPS export ABC transporter periplasmic protein LptC [Rhodoligotrophos appendicifer]